MIKILKSSLLVLTCILCINLSTSALAQEKGDNTMVKLETSMGDIIISLDAEKAPISSQNFLDYVNEGFYDNVIFHRVIENFMIQGGGFDTDMRQKDTKENITNEADNGLSNKKYTIAMARTQEPHSASSQFFINTKDNLFLDFTSPTPQGWGYAVFGEVVEGKDVVDAIEKVSTGQKSFYQDVPLEDVIIKKAYVLEDYKPLAF